LKFSAKLLLFFDMSDHKIVGGCSTLLAKLNKKMHFSRPRSCVYQKNVVPLQPKVTWKRCGTCRKVVPKRC